jgi:hypothetical protein
MHLKHTSLLLLMKAIFWSFAYSGKIQGVITKASNAWNIENYIIKTVLNYAYAAEETRCPRLFLFIHFAVAPANQTPAQI